MKKIIQLLIFLNCVYVNGQCPRIKGILIDACGTVEEKNEWMVLTTNTPILINNLQIDYDASNNAGGATNADVNSINCSWMTPRTSSLDSLKIHTSNPSNLIPISPGGTIPANSTILVLTSDSLTFPYNLSNLTQYGNVYVIQSGCKRTQGAFTNLGNGANYRVTKIYYNSCRDSVWHYIGNSAVNGHYGIRTRDTMRISYGNILTSSCNDFIILPIEISDFYVDCIKDGVLINLKTLSEIDLDYFYFEKSYDGLTWYSFSWNKAKNEPAFYQVNDYDDNVYYRVRIVGLNGKEQISKVIYVNCNKIHNDIIIRNNTVISNNEKQLYIYDLMGRLVIQFNDNYCLSQLPKSIYIIKSDRQTIKITN